MKIKQEGGRRRGEECRGEGGGIIELKNWEATRQALG